MSGEFGATLARDHPNRFGLFAVLPLPDVDGGLAELAYALDVLGAVGVALKTNTHGRYLGDPLFEPLLAELDRRRTIVFVHPTSPPGWQQTTLGQPRPMLEFLFDTTRTVSDLIASSAFDRHPASTASSRMAERPSHCLQRASRCFARAPSRRPRSQPDIGPRRPRSVWYDMAGTPFPLQIPTLTQLVGTEHILYGSAFCFTPPAGVAAQLAAIDRAQPAELGRSWRVIASTNASRLLSRYGWPSDISNRNRVTTPHGP